MKAHVLITGATGMVGKAVLYECMESEFIETIYLVNRRPMHIGHEKVQEIIVPDFKELESIKGHIKNIDACFHCMGVSAMGLNEKQYAELTFGITKKLADICYELNPNVVFNYVSGTGTDSSEQGRIMWARVKGKTENYILNKGFGKAYMFRPGMIIPEKGIKSRTKLYNAGYIITRPLFPWFKKMRNVTTTTRLGKAMVQTLIQTFSERIYLENKDINQLAH